jgi:endonuclease/exonuclease/phosphatase family metal-dependent hydrolase
MPPPSLLVGAARGANRAVFAVSSYNVRRCIGTDGRQAPRRVARVLAEIGADVFGLQEVESRREAPGASEQLEALAEASGLSVVAGPTIRRDDGSYRNALFTSGTVEDFTLHDWSVAGREPRGAPSTRGYSSGAGAVA